jgi:hypothetical protein
VWLSFLNQSRSAPCVFGNHQVEIGGRTPADQETIRYTGFYGQTAAGEPYLMADGEFVPAGTLIRIRTTGGGWTAAEVDWL